MVDVVGWVSQVLLHFVAAHACLVRIRVGADVFCGCFGQRLWLVSAGTSGSASNSLLLDGRGDGGSHFLL